VLDKDPLLARGRVLLPMPNLVFLLVLDQLLPPVKALLAPDPVLPLAQVRVLDLLLLQALAQVHLQAVALVPLQVLNLVQ
jgi:hypothetical protein